jgi:hypothetical protein
MPRGPTWSAAPMPEGFKRSRNAGAGARWPRCPRQLREALDRGPIDDRDVGDNGRARQDALLNGIRECWRAWRSPCRLFNEHWLPAPLDCLPSMVESALDRGSVPANVALPSEEDAKRRPGMRDLCRVHCLGPALLLFSIVAPCASADPEKMLVAGRCTTCYPMAVVHAYGFAQPPSSAVAPRSGSTL